MKHLNHLNHLKPLFCTFSLGLFLAAAAHAQSGTTGACTWRIDGDTLYIEGAGAMANYDNSINRAPWYVYHDNLSRLVIGDGVTSIGNYAFDGCGGFTNYLILPAGLTSIGDYAFSGCIWFEIVYARNPTPPTLGTGVFDGWNLGGVILWTPFAALSSYSAISPWKEFFSIEGTAQVIYDYRYDNLKDTVPEISSGQTGIVLTAPTQPARDGYTFGGWHSDTASLTSLWVFANDAVTGDTVLYAVWFENFDDTFKPVSTCAFSDGVVSLEKRIFTEEPYRPNFDGTKYYKSELAVGVALNGKKVLTVIPAVTGLYAAMTSDRMGRPSMLVDTVRKEIWVFSNSKTASVDYGMEGWAFHKDNMAWTEESVFGAANAGWASYFTGTDDGHPRIAHFSYAGYRNMLAVRNTNLTWSNNDFGYIDPYIIDARYFSHRNILLASEPDMDSIATTYGVFPDVSRPVYSGEGAEKIARILGLSVVTVHFDRQDNTPADSILLLSGVTADPPAEPVRNGYTFGGWYRQAACTDQWDFENDTIYNNTTLYAQWTVNIYNITYHLNGGTNHSDNPATFTVEDTVILQSPSKTGYEFAGWYNNSFLTGTPVSDISAETGDREYWAGWPVVVHFDRQDNTPADSILLLSGVTADPPAEPVRNGYTFGGWYRQAACTDQWDFENDTIYNNTTLYAQWTANIYNITYHLNGGTNHSDNPATFTVEDTVILQSPSKTGCEFAGWYNNSFLTGTAVFGIFAETGDREYWAGWPVVAHVELNDSIGNPVDAQGARVLFYPADGAATTDVYEADRESAGHYRVILPEGQYIAVAENVPGHLTTYYAEAESATQWDDATKLTAAEANGDLNIVFRMKPIPAIKEGKVVIDGYVVYEDGEQKAKVARNATVGIYRSKKGSAQKTFKPDDGEWQLVRTVQPDENGYFVVRNLPAGKYLVVADIPGYELTDGYEIDAENADDTIEGVITFSGNNFVVNDSAQTIAVDVPTSAPDMSESETFRLSPNPFTGELRLTGAEGGTLRVFSSGGALVHIRKTTGADETLHLERLPAGLYFFRLEKDGKVKTLKAVKSE